MPARRINKSEFVSLQKQIMEGTLSGDVHRLERWSKTPWQRGGLSRYTRLIISNDVSPTHHTNRLYSNKMCHWAGWSPIGVRNMGGIDVRHRTNGTLNSVDWYVNWHENGDTHVRIVLYASILFRSSMKLVEWADGRWVYSPSPLGFFLICQYMVGNKA